MLHCPKPNTHVQIRAFFILKISSKQLKVNLLNAWQSNCLNILETMYQKTTP